MDSKECSALLPEALVNALSTHSSLPYTVRSPAWQQSDPPPRTPTLLGLREVLGGEGPKAPGSPARTNAAGRREFLPFQGSESSPSPVTQV